MRHFTIKAIVEVPDDLETSAAKLTQIAIAKKALTEAGGALGIREKRVREKRYNIPLETRQRMAEHAKNMRARYAAIRTIRSVG